MPKTTAGSEVIERTTLPNRLVICESAINALSYYVLFPDGRTRFASIGGKMNRAQPDLVLAQIRRMPQGSGIVAGMDNDTPGRQLAEAVRRAFEACNRADLTFMQREPEGVNDWNDQLRGAKRVPLQPRSSGARPG